MQVAVDNGADVNEECDWGSTGLMIALHQGHNKWVTRASVCLFNTKIQTFSDFQRMRFVRLCGYGDIERVQARIDNGATRADVNEEHCDWGETGLMLAFKNSIYAPKNSQNDLVQLLLNHSQIDVNKVDRRGACALHYAVEGDNHEGMAALLARQDLTTINQRSDYGRTPIMQAVAYNAVNCFNLLLTDPRVDLDTRDNYKRSPEEVRR